MVMEQITVCDLAQFVKAYENDPFSLEVLLFLARHHYTRFSGSAIMYALNALKADVDKAIVRLKEERLVKSYTENGVSFFSLNDAKTPGSWVPIY